MADEASPDEDYPELLETSRKQDDSLWPSGPRCLAGTRYTDADMYDDAKALGNAKFRADDRGRVYRKGLEPGRTWELHGPATAGCWAEDSKDSGGSRRSRRVIRPGKRALDGEQVTMPRGWWHVESGVRWSESRDFGLCAVCGTVLAAGLPPGKQKYCSIGDCARLGSNAARRANSRRKRHPRFKRDADGWYINAAFPSLPETEPENPYVHRFAPWPVFQHHRITPPWMGRTRRIVDLRAGRASNRYKTVTIFDQQNGRFTSKGEGAGKGRFTAIEVIPPPQHLASSTPVSR